MVSPDSVNTVRHSACSIRPSRPRADQTRTLQSPCLAELMLGRTGVGDTGRTWHPAHPVETTTSEPLWRPFAPITPAWRHLVGRSIYTIRRLRPVSPGVSALASPGGQERRRHDGGSTHARSAHATMVELAFPPLLRINPCHESPCPGGARDHGDGRARAGVPGARSGWD